MSAAKFAAEYLHLDKLYLVPTGQPPHKALAETGAGAHHHQSNSVGAEA